MNLKPTDALGNEIQCGDHVVFSQWSRTDLEFGTVKKYVSAQNVTIQLESEETRTIHISNDNRCGGLMVLVEALS